MFEVTIDQRIWSWISHRNDRERRIARPALGKRRPACHPQVRHLPMLHPWIQHTALRRSPHDGSTLYMRALIEGPRIPRPDTTSLTNLSAHSTRDSRSRFNRHIGLGSFMIGPVESKTDQRVAELVGISGVQIEIVLAVGKMAALERH